jgi:hypothetical protein
MLCFSAVKSNRKSFALSRVIRVLLPGVGFIVCIWLALTGCGSGSGSGSVAPPSQAVVITTQPVSQIVPIDRSATFTVAATGSTPLSYQWSKNGVQIPGATNASYTTPTVALSDSGSNFEVTVSNASSSAVSNAVTLTAGARAPAIGDLRYLLWQQVTVPWANGGNAGFIGPGSTVEMESVTDGLGTPLEIGSTMFNSTGCAWPFSFLFVPTSMNGLGLDMYYQWDATNYTPYESYLQSIVAPNAVITSMDLEPACDAIGVSWVQTAQTGVFDYRQEAVPPAQIQATVAADGAGGRIVTAVTFDDSSGNAILISYGWSGDTTTAYDAETVVATPAEVASQATTLANEGYFISAFGGNDNDGYMLIGMRVHGDTLPRPISTNGSTPTDSAYWTTIVRLSEPASTQTINEQ